MSDLEDDVPTLSDEALKALNEFYKEQEDLLGREQNGDSDMQFKENWVRIYEFNCLCSIMLGVLTCFSRKCSYNIPYIETRYKPLSILLMYTKSTIYNKMRQCDIVVP